MSRNGARGKAAYNALRWSLGLILVGTLVVGCARKTGDKSAASVPQDEAKVTSTTVTPVPQAQRSDQPPQASEAASASWVTEAGPAGPVVPSGWVIPDEPQAAEADSGGGPPAPALPSGHRDSSVERSPIQPVGSAPTKGGEEVAQPSEGTVPEAFPNPLRGGQRPAGKPREITPGGSSPPPRAPQPGGEPGPGSAGVAQAIKATKQQRLERPPFDPIKENGEFFVGWTKPRLALVFTGRQDGYFEPCGCAGKDRMKGGLSRRHTMIRQLREQGWPLVVMDVGGLIKGFGKQTEVKFQVTVDALRTIKYDAINLGRNDLRLPAPLLLSVVAPAGQTESEFVSANVALFDFASDQWTSRYRIVEAGGKRVGITAILGTGYQAEIRNPDLAFMDPAEALAKIVPELKSRADILVLLAYAPEDEAFALVKRFPEFTILATSDGPAEPPGSPRFVPETRTLLIQVGEKGMTAVVVGIYDNPDQPFAYQRVILDSRYPDSPEMKQMMVTYQNQLESLGLEGLEIRPVPHPRREIQGEFVGSEKCANCHEKSYLIWKKSGHAKAWDTLVQLDPPRTSDPECISCHVTGWHPTRYFPYQSGFLSEKQTPHLINVGCESCHGPGGEHVAAEMGSDIERQLRAAKAMVVTKEEAESSEVHNCRNCHDLDNSPDFDFAKYWPLVEHYEKE